MTEHHRKIELQSPDDLQYLVSNMRRAANEKIDRDLPPIEGEDLMRTRVEELVHTYINTIFLHSAPSMTINGMDPTPTLLHSVLTNSTSSQPLEIEEHEPFNTKLFEKAKTLAREEEDLVEEIARLRRSMPEKVVDKMREGWRRGVEEDEERIRRVEEVVREQGKVDGGGLVGGLERQGDVEKNWEGAVKGLEGLKRSLPEMVARKERAERAEGYVVKGDRR